MMMMVMMMVQINVSQVNIELCLEPPLLAWNVRALALLRLTYCPFLLIYILLVWMRDIWAGLGAKTLLKWETSAVHFYLVVLDLRARAHKITWHLHCIKNENKKKLNLGLLPTIGLVDRGRALDWRIVVVVFVCDCLCFWYFRAVVVGVVKSTTLVMSTTGSELRGSLD